MNDLLVTALEQHLSGAGLSETLTLLAGDDPQLAQIAQMLALREKQEAERTPDDDELARTHEALAQAQALIEELREQIADLLRYAEEVAADAQQVRDAYELEVSKNQRQASKGKRMEKVIERASRALGSCPTCLGIEEYGDCELCKNRAKPGSLRAVDEEFQELVLPVVRAQLFYTRTRNRRDYPSHQRSES